MLRSAATIVLFFVLYSGAAQSVLDGYKYIIIPRKFDFQKEENKYRLSTISKYLFEKNGYETLLEGSDYPADLKENPCLAGQAEILDESNSFTTKLRVEVKNCLGEVVFLGDQGISRVKEYAESYAKALNNAFVPLEDMEYSYNPNLTIKGNKPENAQVEVASEEAEKSEEADKSEEVDQAEAAVAAGAVAAGTAAANAEVAEQEKELVEASAIENSDAAVKSSQSSEPTKAAGAAATGAVAGVAASEADEKSEAVEVTEAAEDAEPMKDAEPAEMATSYGNENISFFLIDQGEELKAYVHQSKSSNYKKGEAIGTFKKTSLPNVYRVTWKDMDEDIEQTTGYFDEQGNLKIDVQRDGKMEVLTFEKGK